MNIEPLQIHSTFTIEVNEPHINGWEFHCYQCRYRVRYVTWNGHQQYEFEVIDDGDTQARHTGGSTDETRFPKLQQEETSRPEDETWLTPELRNRIDDIFNKLE